MYTLQNSNLKIVVKKTGAELCEISAIKNKTNFMWDAKPDIWGSYAPNLFPIIGALKDDTYIFEGKKYTLPKHGFVRHNQNIELHKQTQNSLTFKLTYNDELLKSYPFKFEFHITYTLIDNAITVTHKVKNCDTKTMYFSIGGHPAFKCPVFENDTYEDYYLEFEHVENSKRHLINMENGLISNKTEAVFNHSNQIALQHELFEKDALVFKDLKSRKVSLKSKNHGTILTVSFPEFNYLGIWAKPTGNYVCIEPWLGIADSENTNQDFKTKEGILKLDSGKTFEASYTIEIQNINLS
ncbi:aldose 1-epimerase family protein [Litoribaculum gwangyangense]|uniref:Aldose 1-epimerase family protein n=1 Tax=Litoribaculum gwangyangense TaxID=1130722 RepID=A0ABP9CLM1_9FLAO